MLVPSATDSSPISASACSSPISASAWWREWQLYLLVLLVMLGYFWRASAMSMRGEETRRALVSVEMIDRDDWVIPRDQGELFLSRPPLHNWLIALSYLGLGERDVFGARLPSLAATLLTVLLLYGYGRTFLSRNGALAAAAAYATFGEIFQTGRMAETEAVFILFVSASLLVWHWGMVRNWPALVTWSAGYALMALAGLSKGPQAPVYFIGLTSAYLVLTWQWRRLFSLPHLVGFLVGSAILASWQVPYYLAVGGRATWLVWMNDTMPRLLDWKGLVGHLVVFPLQVLGCTMPWSPLVFLFLRRDVRQSVGAARPQVLFLTVCLVLAFPTCWLPPAGQTRYIAPLYPCFALMLGFVVQCCGQADPASALGTFWRRCLGSMVALMLMVAFAIASAGLLTDNSMARDWAEPPLAATAFVAATLVLACLALWARRTSSPWRTGLGAISMAGFMVALFNGPVLDARIRRGVDMGPPLRALKEKLPADAMVVSLGHVDSDFAFYCGKIPRPLPWPSPTPPNVPDRAYFCFIAIGKDRPVLPFRWEEVTVVSMDRNWHPEPERALVVARRLPEVSGRMEASARSVVP
jgi:4-amino-4-deoxy-L-arabinose transferase-like glycosyltransferase